MKQLRLITLTILLISIYCISCNRKKGDYVRVPDIVFTSEATEELRIPVEASVRWRDSVDVLSTEYRWFSYTRKPSTRVDTLIITAEKNYSPEMRYQNIYIVTDKLGVFTIPIQQKAAIDYTEDIEDYNLRNILFDVCDSNADGHITKPELLDIRQLDIRDQAIRSLAGIELMGNLIKLTCSHNKIGTLDLSHNLQLTDLECVDCNLDYLDVSMLKDLKVLYCGGNNLTQLNVRQNTKLTHLGCNENKLTSIDISQNTELASVNLSQNKIGNLDLSQHTKLLEFNANECGLTQLDLSASPDLTTLRLGRNAITDLYINNNRELGKACRNNKGCFDSMYEPELKRIYVWKGFIESEFPSEKKPQVYEFTYPKGVQFIIP